MAFTKKAKPADAVEEPEPEEEEPAPTAVETTLDEASAEAGGGDDADMMASLASEEPEEAAEGAESLLDMFTSVGIEVIDRSTLTNLAGEVDMADLVSELNIVAAALGIVMSERTHHEELFEEDQIAA